MLNFYSAVSHDSVNADSSPIDISEIIDLCKEYTYLGLNIQSQIDYILENGFDEAIKNNKLNHDNLQHIKNFMSKLSKLYYLDAALQAEDCLKELNKIKSVQVNVN